MHINAFVLTPLNCTLYCACLAIKFACYCRDKNPLLKTFQLHVLSLTVLREAVYPSNCSIIMNLRSLFSHAFVWDFECSLQAFNEQGALYISVSPGQQAYACKYVLSELSPLIGCSRLLILRAP